MLIAERFHLLEIGMMSFDLPDEASRAYRYVRLLDRHVTKPRHKAASRQSVAGFKWLLIKFVLVIPALTVVIVLIQRTATRYVLFTEPAGSTTARLTPPHGSIHSQ